MIIACENKRLIRMAEYKPIVAVEDFDTINNDECVEGYLYGRSDKAHGEFISPHSCTRSFYHGYLNGMVETGKLELSIAQKELAHALRKAGRLEGLWDLMESFAQNIVNPEREENRMIQ